MSQFQYFCTRNDLLNILSRVESTSPLQYTETGTFESHTFLSFESCTAIADLGIADQPTGSVCRSYLMMERGYTPHSRLIATIHGNRYCMDQLVNHDSVVLTPAGCWKESVLLQGVVGTASKSAASLSLLKLVKASLLTSCLKVQGRFVGTEALEKLRAGWRLTISEQSPSQFDIARPNG